MSDRPEPLLPHGESEPAQQPTSMREEARVLLRMAAGICGIMLAMVAFVGVAGGILWWVDSHLGDLAAFLLALPLAAFGLVPVMLAVDAVTEWMDREASR